MSADTSDLAKVDSGVGGMEQKKRRTTSSAPGVMNINDLGMIKYCHLGCNQLTNAQRLIKSRSRCHQIHNRQAGMRGLMMLSYTLTIIQEAQRLVKHSARPLDTEEDAHRASCEEDRPALPTWSRGHCTKPEGSHDQRCSRRHPQAIQEEGETTHPGDTSPTNMHRPTMSWMSHT